MTAPEARCNCCDLPVSSCGVRRPGVPVEQYEGVLIERFLVAKYEGKCNLVDGHRIQPGTTIGLAVEDEGGEKIGWVCATCVQQIVG